MNYEQHVAFTIRLKVETYGHSFIKESQGHLTPKQRNPVAV